jgi:hypothetical protein
MLLAFIPRRAVLPRVNRLVVSIGGVLLLAGCLGPALVLHPQLESGGALPVGHSVRLLVAPGTEFPDLSPREAQLLATLYTAVWVRVQNDSNERSYLDPAQLLLYDRTGTPWLVLDPTRRNQYRQWPPWSFQGSMRRLFLRRQILALDERLRDMTVSPGWVDPGATLSGLLLYKLIDRKLCDRVVLEWRRGWQADEPSGRTDGRAAPGPDVQAVLHCSAAGGDAGS